MKPIRTLIVLLTLLLCLSCMSAQAASAYTLGRKIDDFTVTTFDGQTITLSEILKEKEAVLINVWATWCGPCRSEFPHFQSAYEQLSNQIEIVALTSEPTDTNEKLANFASQLGLTFPIARDTVNMAYRLQASAIPTSIIVDRFGTVCFRVSGAMPNTEAVLSLFEPFLGEGYTESLLFSGLPAKASAQPADPAEIAAALEVGTARNPANAYLWPMTIAEKDGRTVIASTNRGKASSSSTVSVTLTASRGDALAVTFKTSTEALFDLMKISLNDKAIKAIGGEHDWTTYAIPVETDGEQTLTLSYQKNGATDSGEDTIWVDQIAVLSGSEAEAALNAAPAWALAEETALYPLSSDVREIIIGDPQGLLPAAFGSVKCYVAGSDSVAFAASITADVDPESAFFFSNYDNAILPLVSSHDGSAFRMTSSIDSIAKTGYTCTSLCLYPSASGEGMLVALIFRDAANLEAFISMNSLDGWRYANESAYTIRYVDQHGNPVQGVMLQVCDEELCQVFVSDADGFCQFSLAPYAWELHTLQLPEGYEGDIETITYAPVEGGTVTFTLTRQ